MSLSVLAVVDARSERVLVGTKWPHLPMSPCHGVIGPTLPRDIMFLPNGAAGHRFAVECASGANLCRVRAQPSDEAEPSRRGPPDAFSTNSRLLPWRAIDELWFYDLYRQMSSARPAVALASLQVARTVRSQTGCTTSVRVSMPRTERACDDLTLIERLG